MGAQELGSRASFFAKALSVASLVSALAFQDISQAETVASTSGGISITGGCPNPFVTGPNVTISCAFLSGATTSTTNPVTVYIRTDMTEIAYPVIVRDNRIYSPIVAAGIGTYSDTPNNRLYLYHNNGPDTVFASSGEYMEREETTDSYGRILSQYVYRISGGAPTNGMILYSPLSMVVDFTNSNAVRSEAYEIAVGSHISNLKMVSLWTENFSTYQLEISNPTACSGNGLFACPGSLVSPTLQLSGPPIVKDGVMPGRTFNQALKLAGRKVGGGYLVLDMRNSLIRYDLPMEGDVTQDGVLSNLDINAVQANIGGTNIMYDVNNDMVINSEDVTYLQSLMPPPPVRIPGDFNCDGVVNGADLNVYNANVRRTDVGDCMGDADGDHDVDGNDFLIWQRNLGRRAAALETAVVASAETAQNIYDQLHKEFFLDQKEAEARGLTRSVNPTLSSPTNSKKQARQIRRLKFLRARLAESKDKQVLRRYRKAVAKLAARLNAK